MERQKAKKPKFRQLKRIGTMALAATIALSVPTVSNVVSKVSPISNIEVSAAEQTNLMNVNGIGTTFHVNHNDYDEHWTHSFSNDGDMYIDGPEFDVTNLKYVVKFPDALGHLLDDEYVRDYLFGDITNYGTAQNSFMVSGYAIDESGKQITLNKDTHKPYEHISINKVTNSVEFDFNSYYTENNLKPYIRTNISGEYIFNNLGFTTPIIVPDSRILDNGTYEFKSAIVRGTSVDLDNVSNAYSENLVVDYSTDPKPEPEPEVDKSDLEAALVDAEGYDIDDYTEESYLIFSAAAEAALFVWENEDATQSEVDGAVADLAIAIDGLEDAVEPEPEEVDLSVLAALVEEANDIEAAGFTEESFAVFTAAVEAAEAVLVNGEATQGEVDDALANLQAAIEGLEEVVVEPTPDPEPTPEVDTEELATAVTNADGYDVADYTEESFATLTAAVEAAETVLANEEATQEEVDGALEVLQAAIDGLAKVDVETEEPKEEVTIDDGSDDSNEKVEIEKEEGEGNRLPNTATSSFNMILAGFLALLVGAGSLVLGRRKLN